jgi:hypothetical protein
MRLFVDQPFFKLGKLATLMQPTQRMLSFTGGLMMARLGVIGFVLIVGVGVATADEMSRNQNIGGQEGRNRNTLIARHGSVKRLAVHHNRTRNLNGVAAAKAPYWSPFTYAR